MHICPICKKSAKRIGISRGGFIKLRCNHCPWHGLGPELAPGPPPLRIKCCNPRCSTFADTQQPWGWRCGPHHGIRYMMCGQSNDFGHVCTLPINHEGDVHAMWTDHGKQYVSWHELECEDCNGTGETMEAHCDGGTHGERDVPCEECGETGTHTEIIKAVPPMRVVVSNATDEKLNGEHEIKSATSQPAKPMDPSLVGLKDSGFQPDTCCEVCRGEENVMYLAHADGRMCNHCSTRCGHAAAEQSYLLKCARTDPDTIPLSCATLGCDVIHPNAVAWDKSMHGWRCREHEEAWDPSHLEGLTIWIQNGVNMLTGKPIDYVKGAPDPVIACSRKLTGSELRKLQQYVEECS